MMGASCVLPACFLCASCALPACFLLYCCYILWYTHITTALIGNDGCFLRASCVLPVCFLLYCYSCCYILQYTKITTSKLNWTETHTILPTFLGSTQEAHMGATCVLPRKVDRMVWISDQFSFEENDGCFLLCITQACYWLGMALWHNR